MKHSGGFRSLEFVGLLLFAHGAFVGAFFPFFYPYTLQITIFFTSFKLTVSTSLGLLLQRVPRREQPFLHGFDFC